MTRNSVLKPNFFQRIPFLNPITFQITHNEKAEKKTVPNRHLLLGGKQTSLLDPIA